MLTVFQVITNEGWTDIMYWVSPKSFHDKQIVVLSGLFFIDIRELKQAQHRQQKERHMKM